MRRRAYRTWSAAAGLLAATCAIVSAAVPTERVDHEESWWLLKLGSADRVARVRAAEALAAMRCIRAVSGIVRVIAEDSEERITVRNVGFFVTAVCSNGAPLVMEPIEKAEATPVVFALWTMGEPAVPALRGCLIEKRFDARTRGILRRLLDRSEPLSPRVFLGCR